MGSSLWSPCCFVEKRDSGPTHPGACASPLSCEAPSEPPSETPEQPLSSSDSESARTTAQNAPLGSFG
eukprot:13131621-Alexandrium_andersonii.AAC.1